MARLNLAQRIVLVGGLAAAMTFFGEWVATLHGFRYVYNFPYGSGSGSVHGKRGMAVIGSFPSQPVPTGLHPWAVMLVWIGLAALWTVVAVWMFRRLSPSSVPGPSVGPG